MLDIGWSEFLVIGVIALLVIGPKELPGALRTAGQYMARARSLAREFRDGLDDIAREAELKDIEKKIVGDDWLEAEDKPASARSETAKTGGAPALDMDEAESDEALAADLSDQIASNPPDNAKPAAPKQTASEPTAAEPADPPMPGAKDEGVKPS